MTYGTLRDRMSALRWYAGKIGSPNITARGNDAYGIAERRYVTNVGTACQTGFEHSRPTD
ncbi:MAG: hypothetical protein HY525_12070 [Betaproteobacteria bacterium]|nr:hypothetical protein [Betaproteobacteria bacterium]